MTTLPDIIYREGSQRAGSGGFGAYNHRRAAMGDEIYDMYNMSSREQPLLHPRRPRRLIDRLDAPGGVTAVDSRLLIADGTELRYDGLTIGAVAAGRVDFYHMGAYIIIWPDKLYWRTGARGSYDTLAALAEAVTEPDYGDIYRVGSGAPYLLYYWDGTEWAELMQEVGSLESSVQLVGMEIRNGVIFEEAAEANTIYSATADFAECFKPGDAVTISGCSRYPANNKTPIVREISEDGHELRFSEHAFATPVGLTVDSDGLAAGAYRFEDGGTEYGFRLSSGASLGHILLWDGETLTLSSGSSSTVISVGTPESGAAEISFPESFGYSEAGTITIARTVPDMDWLCENENRLWGCKGKSVYASKLGDPFNFNVFDGLATDSWSVEVLSEGDFTGCISFLGYPIFFKERNIYKVYGTIPSNFQLMGSASSGVKSGSGRSLAIAGNTLFYHGVNGVMSYSGGIPELISQGFGATKYKDAVAGSDGRRYWISMCCGDEWSLFVFDTDCRLWRKQDATQAVGFALAEELICLDTEGVLWQNGAGDETVDWWAESGYFYERDMSRKGYSKLLLRVEVTAGASMTVHVQYDSSGVWQQVASVIRPAVRKTWYLPLIPRRCDHLRLRVAGSGEVYIHELAREYYHGSPNG